MSVLLGTLPDKETVMTGIVAILNSSTIGSSASDGNSDFAKSTFSLTSLKTLSLSKLISNSKRTEP